MADRSAPWQPRFCPYPDCGAHAEGSAFRYRHYGFYRRACQPQKIQRFRCGHCRRTFSTQTFSTTYWLKRPDLQPPLFFRSLACSGYRQIAREFGIAPTTVLGQLARLGRHCLLFHEARRPALTEPLAVDGFESFEFSQYHPCHFHVAVGAASHFFYGFTDSELRRKGRMTALQKQRRAWLEQHCGRPHPRAIEHDVAALLEIVVPTPQAVELRTDEHPDYPRALRHLPGWTFQHHTTGSRERRTARNPLFPVNRLDLLIRHSGANHKRETIAFSKRRQSALERLAIFAVWLNWMKPFSENHGGGTPAMRLGRIERPLAIEEVLGERRFVSRTRLPERIRRYYFREIPTRRIPNGRRHRLKRAV